MPVAKFKLRVPPVEAIQYTRETIEEVKAFLPPTVNDRDWKIDVTSNRLRIFNVPLGKADFGDWVVKGPEGYFTVKENEFKETYERIADAKVAVASTK